MLTIVAYVFTSIDRSFLFFIRGHTLQFGFVSIREIISKHGKQTYRVGDASDAHPKRKIG